ncbi:MAG: biotin-dependent carboxyltransferase family protein [Oscillospiraceae bacterium]|nr:biotin-dependent carboxyltransferase family protein [Oscillospiraceae bacterium]MDY5580994.1 biotin-dependent carboxyltransferase family protein [Oscillospiraceae bacterium]
MSMHIISPGMLTTVQDLGRRGYMASGFQQGGAMDQFAARAANILLDNSESDGVLEMTLLGVKAYFDEDNVIAITGAEFVPTVTDSETGEVTELPINRAVRVKKGDVLDCGSAKSGLRGYLAVAGGFDIAPVMGSMSTNLKCKVGGFDGRKLKSGDVLSLRYPQSDLYGMTSRVFESEKQKNGTVTVHVIPGPQDDYFSDKGKNIFYSETYSVTGDSDRMGIKLDGTPVESIDGVDIISDGIVAGSVQIPSSGKPIIMMADRQTTGGYAKIATVITSDLPLLAQLRPGGSLRFERVDLQYAVKRIKQDNKLLKKLQYKILRADTSISGS